LLLILHSRRNHLVLTQWGADQTFASEFFHITIYPDAVVVRYKTSITDDSARGIRVKPIRSVSIHRFFTVELEREAKLAGR